MEIGVAPVGCGIAGSTIDHMEPGDLELHKGPSPSRSKDDRATELIEVLMAIARSTRNLRHRQLMEIDVPPGQDEFLMALGRGELRKLSRVADEVHIRVSTASKMVDQLENKGWAIREKIEGDGRAVAVRITPDGEEVRRKVQKIWSDLEGDIGVAVGEAAFTQVHDALEQVEEALRSRLARLR